MKNYKMIITILVIVAAGVGTHFWNKNHKSSNSNEVKKTIETKEINKTALRAKMKKEGVILTINDRKYKKEDFPKEYMELKDKGKERFLSKYLYLKVTLESLQDKKEKYKNQIEQSVKEERKKLAKCGVTLDELETELSTLGIILNEIAYQEVLKKHQNIFKEAKEFYTKNKDGYIYSDTIEISHISVEDEKKAEEIIFKLQEQNLTIKNFAKLAKEYSQDLVTIYYGGYVGKVSKKELGDEIFQQLSNLKKGNISKKPIKDKKYYHIVYVLDKIPAHTENFKDIEKSIIKHLIDKDIKRWKRSSFRVANKKTKVEVYDIKIN